MFKIISTGWKCDKTIDRCMDSVEAQTHRDAQHYVVIDDAGGNTVKFDIKDAAEKRIPRLITYRKGRRGKMYNFVQCLEGGARPPADDDIIVDLDLDDWLLPRALEVVQNAYDRWPELLLTYGSYITVSGRPARFNGHYKTDDFRMQRWKASHLKAFKYKLFGQIKKKDLKGKDGRYLMVCADMAMMFPMMEMAGLKRIYYNEVPIYVYDDTSTYNDHKMQFNEQKRIEKYIRSKARYKEW